MNPSDDLRWHRMMKREWTCPSCGEEHQGLFDLCGRHPAQWPHGEEYEENAALRFDGDFLSEDFCVLGGEHFFVRSALLLPIKGTDLAFGFGVWCTLSRKNLDLYIESFDSGVQAHLGPFFGWFSTEMRGYPDTINIKAQLYPQNGRKRPVVKLMPDDHPLAIDQRNGITFDQVLDLYARYDHDIRAALGPAEPR